ncbi:MULTISPECIES: hypothetical protein [unclassified Rathayibacter]|uniref:hypothetical protein n=1 Tax=unclassified Rathayibacter TaxID=2609250 RepID=UPI0006FB6BE6|nr:MULTISPECIES: hypothetical protein [unclassified Rathayibacter]KQQ06111.1 hypothetical protein ASF42_06225 [Rathayibacter sp. Leaf294]KQS13968.1 hypothetical protein ASG06_06235 [Rathayibacter sp. Leaf185]
MTELLISRDGDIVVVAPIGFPASLERRHTLVALSGGHVAFAVDERDPALRAVIHDLDAAMWWLPLVLGAEVADAARRASVDSEPITRSAEEAAHPLRATLLRLGLALWLRRWWPTRTDTIPKLPAWLLDIEAGDTAFDCEVALGDDDALARLLLEPHVVPLAALRRRHQSLLGGRPLLGYADSILQRAAHSLLESSDPDSDGYSELAEAEVRAGREDALVARELEDLDLELLTIQVDERTMRTSSGSPADRFGSASGADLSGSASVDPLAVPPRVVSAEDDAVRWQIFEFDGRRQFRVMVDADEGAVERRLPLGGLFARVDYGDGLVAGVALAAVEGGYDGETDLDATVPVSEVLVTVYSDAVGADGFQPRSEAERSADRAAIAAVVDARVDEARRTVSRGTVPAGAWADPFLAELRGAGLDLGGER